MRWVRGATRTGTCLVIVSLLLASLWTTTGVAQGDARVYVLQEIKVEHNPYARDSPYITRDIRRMDSMGGLMDVTYRSPDANCPGAMSHRYSWAFAQDVSRLSPGGKVEVVLGIQLLNQTRMDCWDGRVGMHLTTDQRGISVMPEAYPDTLVNYPSRNNPYADGKRTVIVAPDRALDASFILNIEGPTGNNTGGFLLSFNYPYKPVLASTLPTVTPVPPPPPTATPRPAMSAAMPAVAGGTPAPGLTLLGTVDFKTYCVNTGTDGAALAEGVWSCEFGGDLYAIDLNDACRIQYKNVNAVARQRVLNNPLTWGCYIQP